MKPVPGMSFFTVRGKTEIFTGKENRERHPTDKYDDYFKSGKIILKAFFW